MGCIGSIYQFGHRWCHNYHGLIFGKLDLSKLPERKLLEQKLQQAVERAKDRLLQMGKND